MEEILKLPTKLLNQIDKEVPPHTLEGIRIKDEIWKRNNPSKHLRAKFEKEINDGLTSELVMWACDLQGSKKPEEQQIYNVLTAKVRLNNSTWHMMEFQGMVTKTKPYENPKLVEKIMPEFVASQAREHEQAKKDYKKWAALFEEDQKNLKKEFDKYAALLMSNDKDTTTK